MPPRPSALFLTPEAPYPLAGGGSLRTASLLEYLALHYAVDVIVFRQPGAPDPAGLIPAAWLAASPCSICLPTAAASPPAPCATRAAWCAVSRRWWTASRVSSGRSPSALEGARYDMGVIEHFWCAPYLEQLSPACARTVLDLHNVEPCCTRAARQWRAAPRRRRTAFSRAPRRNWSAPGCRAFPLVLATSHADADLARAIAPQAQVAVYPNALPPTPLPPAGDEEAVVFSGNMEYHPNLSAVRFFRQEVWPRLRERWPDLVWRLVGKNPGAVQR